MLVLNSKLLPDDLKKKINIVGENFNSVDFIVSTSNFIGDPKYVARYKKPENFKLLYQIKKGNITAILNDDVNQLERFLNNGVNQIIQVFVSTICIGRCQRLFSIFGV